MNRIIHTRSAPLLSFKRFLSSSASDPSSKEMAERSILLTNTELIKNNKPLKKERTKIPKQGNNDDDLKLLEESIQKAELLAQSNYSDPKQFRQLPFNYARNQHLNIDDVNSTELSSILWKFDAPIRYSFAYGSGVFDQGYHNPDTQIDLIFAVTYPEHWHSINMRYNKDHYSSLRYFGSGVVSKFQEIGAGVYFNPYVEIDGKLVKYGVISIDSLAKDLAKWDSFYLAGRLQKPVKILRDDPMIRYWNQQNLKSAATLAYLNLPENQPFDEMKFYKNITKLSYLGDIRYKLGAENPKKIDNIVQKNFSYFQHYYSPILNEVINQKKFSFQPGFTKENANSKLRDTIFKTSTIQTMKGLLTAGLNKSIRYAYAKKMKAKS